MPARVREAGSDIEPQLWFTRTNTVVLLVFVCKRPCWVMMRQWGHRQNQFDAAVALLSPSAPPAELPLTAL